MAAETGGRHASRVRANKSPPMNAAAAPAASTTDSYRAANRPGRRTGPAARPSSPPARLAELTRPRSEGLRMKAAPDGVRPRRPESAGDGARFGRALKRRSENGTGQTEGNSAQPGGEICGRPASSPRPAWGTRRRGSLRLGRVRLDLERLQEVLHPRVGVRVAHVDHPGHPNRVQPAFDQDQPDRRHRVVRVLASTVRSTDGHPSVVPDVRRTSVLPGTCVTVLSAASLRIWADARGPARRSR